MAGFFCVDGKRKRAEMELKEASCSRSWARRLICCEDWVVFDAETTGLRETAELIEIGIVSSNGSIAFEQLIRPESEVERGAVRVHGLTKEALRNAPSFDAISPALASFLGGKIVIAFNAGFDRRVLEYSSTSRGYPIIECEWVCALDRYEDWRGFRAPLQVVCEIEGISVERKHRAADDALLVWQLMLRMAGESPKDL